MTRQTSIQLDADTERRIQYLTQCGYGKQTNIVRTAIALLYARELKRSSDELIQSDEQE